MNLPNTQTGRIKYTVICRFDRTAALIGPDGKQNFDSLGDLFDFVIRAGIGGEIRILHLHGYNHSFRKEVRQDGKQKSPGCDFDLTA